MQMAVAKNSSAPLAPPSLVRTSSPRRSRSAALEAARARNSHEAKNCLTQTSHTGSAP